METLLAAWDAGRRQTTAMRALTMLEIGFPDATREQLSDFSVGDRNRSLMRLRQAVFGKQAAALTACPLCGESLELDIPVPDLQLDVAEKRGATKEIRQDGYRIRFRLPRCRDLIAAARAADLFAAARLLFERCVECADREGQPVDCSAIPPALAAAVAGRMEELDPQGELRLHLTCPACAAEWDAEFDIVTFLWIELDAWACRLLREVHTLASAYHWRESDILAMSASRREFYLGLVGG